MADSVIQIVNSALVIVGEDFITSLDDGSPAAKKAKLKYPLVRDHVLRQHPWNCAIAQEVLAPLAIEPLFGFTKQYTLPNNPYCLRVLAIDDEVGTRARPSKSRNIAPFFIQGRKLLTNIEDEITLTYISRVENPTIFDAMLVSVLAARLAMELSYDITGSNTNYQKAQALYLDELAKARAIDAREQGNWYQDSPTITSRFGGNTPGINVIPPGP